MDKEHLKGELDKASGAAKDVIGDVKDGIKKAHVDAQRGREAKRGD